MARRLPSKLTRARNREARAVTTALLLGLASLLGLATCEPRGAAADPSDRCGTYAEISSAMRALDEAPMFQGLNPRGVVLELWAGPSGSWTVIYVDATGLACLAVEGEAGVVLVAPVEERRG